MNRFLRRSTAAILDVAVSCCNKGDGMDFVDKSIGSKVMWLADAGRMLLSRRGWWGLLMLCSCSAPTEAVGRAQNGQPPKILDNKLAPQFKLVSSGGVPTRRGLCPSEPLDVLVPLTSVHPPPKVGEPEMTISGLQRFIEEEQIHSISELLNHFPVHFRTNFSLVELTRATGQSSLKYPRIILFGSDGRLLMNVGTKPDDPKYNILDIAELHKTGQWEFSSFDFSGEQPTLDKNPESCLECHGRENPRPFWGTNQDWPGVFGDNIADGPQGEALDGRHVKRIHEIMDGNGSSKRFDFLIWDHRRLRRGGFRRIAHHVLGAELLLSNIAFGTAVGRGVFVRMKREHPQEYHALREALLLLGFVRSGSLSLNAQEKDALLGALGPHGVRELSLDDVLRVLGIDTKQSFSLGTLAEKEPPLTNWRMGLGDLYELVLLQVMDDLARDDSSVAQILKTTSPGDGVFGCPNLASNLHDVIDYKMLHLFHLRGAARYEVNRVFYAADAEDVYGKIFKPAANTLGTYLLKKLGAKPLHSISQ